MSAPACRRRRRRAPVPTGAVAMAPTGAIPLAPPGAARLPPPGAVKVATIGAVLVTVAAAVLVALAGGPSFAAEAPEPANGLLQAFEERTTVRTLDNGWTFILVERPVAPVFSFATYADVGSAQEVAGITGLAHMFEHMAFKGTPTIGTRDWPAEREALERVEAAYQGYQEERLSANPDPERLAELESAFERAQEEAGRYAQSDEFGRIVDQEGGVGLNAFTSADVTGYFYSLPANKVELFAFLESERFLHPVFRDFYKERDVVQEERRLSTESQPLGRLVEQFATTAFMAHPYQQPVIGYMSDLRALTMTDARRFFETYYVPANLVTVVVGDIDAGRLLPLLERYFGRIKKGPEPPPLRTVEPPQIAEKVVVLEDPAQPYYLEGYHKPAATHPDQPIFDAIDDILSNGRTSRLYRSLVRDLRIAVAVDSFSGYPGAKYPNLWAVLAIPAPGASNEEIQAAVRAEIERLKTEEVTAAELAKFKTRARASLLRSLDSNSGLAHALAEYQTIFGDWRELFRYIDRLEKVTGADIRRVAEATFREPNRTVARIVTGAPDQAPAAPDSVEDGR